MRLSQNILSLGRDESGGVLVMTVIAAPLLVIVLIFVIDVANWFEHRSHLQMQADAAVFAAAEEMRIPCDNQPILDKANDYGGALYNAQVGGTPSAKVHMLINSRTYYNQAAPTDDTVNPASPCQAGMVDVKLTETDLPWFFGVGSVPFINAHARVSILQADTSSGALPVGVPDVNPKSARIIFVDESNNGAVLGSRTLTKVGYVNGVTVWDNSGSPLPVTVNTDKIGVRVALSGSSSTARGDSVVQCYDANDPQKGILFSVSLPSVGALKHFSTSGRFSGETTKITHSIPAVAICSTMRHNARRPPTGSSSLGI